MSSLRRIVAANAQTVTKTGAILSLAVTWPQAQRGQGQNSSQSQGWAVRASLNNPNARLYNNAKQKLLDGKQIFGYTISKLDTKLYCEVAQHWISSGSKCSTARCRSGMSRK
jgi:hypothetical protein